MNSQDKPKPIQIRLPQDVEDSLRYAASKSNQTINSVVIACLQEHLPAVSRWDLAAVDGVVGFLQKTEQQLRDDVLERLDRYQQAVQFQLEAALQLAAALNAQAIHARRMQASLRIGANLRVPDDPEGTLPDLRTERGLSPELFSYLDSSHVVKTEAAIKNCRKAMARHQYDAVSQWEAVKELLPMLEQAATAGKSATGGGS